MGAHREIEVWYTNLVRREFVFAASMAKAKHICKLEALKGNTGICVDVVYRDIDGDIIEGRSRWYSYENGKLVKI
jgi:hypothetical protein